MRLPIKLNQAGWPARFARLSFAFHDPRPLANGNVSDLSPPAFSNAISTLQFGVTFKTTRPGRHQHSNRVISELFRGSKPVILDVGASDGSTSLDLIRSVNGDLERYFVTDLNLSTRCGYDPHGALYFLDQSGTCRLRASRRFLVYSEVSGATVPLRYVAQALLSRFRQVTNWREVLLIQPELIRLAERDPHITIMRYDLFAPWKGMRPDLIKIANLLNRKYFTDEEMKEALKIQCLNLGTGGRLLLVSEDDDIEKFSLFRRSSTGMVLEYTHGGGAKAAHLVTSVIPVTFGATSQFDQEALA